jgi:putative transposase
MLFDREGRAVGEAHSRDWFAEDAQLEHAETERKANALFMAHALALFDEVVRLRELFMEVQTNSAEALHAEGIAGCDEGGRLGDFTLYAKDTAAETLSGARHLLIFVYITPADLSDPAGARKLLGGLAYFVPRLKKIWADAAYRGKELAHWCQQQGAGWELVIVEREPGTQGFQVQPRGWVVERSLAWLSRNRRLAKEYECKIQSSETLIELAAIRLVLRRLARR